MAEETIYLCNFRVSVDGDWLCLKELADVQLDMVTHEEEEGQSITTFSCAYQIHIFSFIWDVNYSSVVLN